MIKIIAFAAVTLATATLTTRSHADDPCDESREKVLAFVKALDLTATDKAASSGHFQVMRVPSNINLASERFEIRYLVNGKVMWNRSELPNDDGELGIKAAAKRLLFDFYYGAGGHIQCHYVISVKNGESGYRQFKGNEQNR